MKHNTSELDGAFLDAAVAKALGMQHKTEAGVVYVYTNPCGWPGACPGWYRITGDLDGLLSMPTVEKKRAFVVSKLGDEVEL